MKRFLNAYAWIIVPLLLIVLVSLFLQSEAQVVAWALGSVGLMIIVFIVERSRRARQLRKLQQERLKLEVAHLKSQLNPHFFFNTLNNLYSLSLTDPDQTPELLLKLSDLMRYTIYKGREAQVSLKEEMAYLKNYLALSQIRFKKKPLIQWKEQLMEGSQKIPPLLFIVLVENAFKHGMETEENEAFLKIEVVEAPKKLYFKIANSYHRTAYPKPQDGIGLKNLKRRLELEYPNRHRLTIKQGESTFEVKIELMAS
ncbi:sensor histidine kinase [Croceiramulus getboli]|nr:histidine kinase [Flavobacteriaceae bacterium YJPT1-3]